MKKMSSCVFAVMILLSAIIVPVFAEPATITDERTGVTYEKSYVTYVSGSVSDVEYESNPITYIGAPTYYKTLWTDITSSEVQASIKECNDRYTNALSTAPPSGSIEVPFIFLDGYVRNLDIDDNETWIILKYFDISQKLNGTKTVTKKGIPFTFHGDGKGNITVEVITDQIGVKTERIELPIERKYWKEETVKTKYYLTYMYKPSVGVGLGTGEFETLEEALDECVKKADLNKKIRIEKNTDYNVEYYGKIYDLYILNIEYGWVDRSEFESTTENKNSTSDEKEEKPTKPQNDKTENVSKVDKIEKIEDPTTSETVSSTENTTAKTDEQVNATVSQTENKTDDTTENKDNKDKNNATPIIIAVSVVAVGAVAVGVTFALKKKKK